MPLSFDETITNIDNFLNLTEQDISVYPNPYTHTSAISYTLNESAQVSVEVYNLLGTKIQTLVNATQAQGKYEYNFSAKSQGHGPGTYILKASINKQNITKKLIELQ
jgi:serine protease AprX